MTESKRVKEALEKAKYGKSMFLVNEDFSIECVVSLSLEQQLELIKTTLEVIDLSNHSQKHTAVMKRAMFEATYTTAFTDALTVFGLNHTDAGHINEVYVLCREIDIIGRLCETDPRTARMFDLLWQSVLEGGRGNV